jgi:hypothetical protein
MKAFEVNKSSTPTIPNITKGFKITFDNGYTVSVQIGHGTYSDNGESTAEVAITDPDDKFVRIFDDQNDDVMPYCSPEDVANIVSQVAEM